MRYINFCQLLIHIIYLKQPRHDGIRHLQAYQSAIEHSPDRGIHHGGRANALGALGREEDAEAAWEQALSLDPTLTWMRSL